MRTILGEARTELNGLGIIVEPGCEWCRNGEDESESFESHGDLLCGDVLEMLMLGRTGDEGKAYIRQLVLEGWRSEEFQKLIEVSALLNFMLLKLT